MVMHARDIAGAALDAFLDIMHSAYYYYYYINK